MIRLQNILKASLQDVLKMSWRRFCRRLEVVLTMSWRRFCKTSWRRLSKTSWQDVLKTSWRHLEDVWPKWIYWSWSRHLEDVLKTSSEGEWLRRIYSSWSRRLQDVFKTSPEDEDERRLQDVFIKTNVCWVVSNALMLFLRFFYLFHKALLILLSHLFSFQPL